MKNKKKNFIFAIGFFVGLSILLYPMISSRWNAYRAGRLLSSYRETVQENTDQEEYDRQLAAAQEYNKTIQQESVPDAFSIRDGVQDDEYDSMLTVGEDGLMGSIEIPAIGETLPIYHYTTGESLEKGVGHLFGSSLPVGGGGTHAILSAHRGLPSAKLFTDLPLLEDGDVFYLHILGNTLAYEVDQKLTVEPHEVSALAITEGKDYVTLITCTPYAVNSHRLLVRGHRVDFVQEQYEKLRSEPAKKDVVQIWMQILCVCIGLVIAFIIVGVVNFREKRRIGTDAAEGKRAE